MQPDREGIFHAYPVDMGVNELGPNHLTVVTVRLRLFEEFRDGEWVDCYDEELEITAYFYIERKDGSLVDFRIDQLKEALGWDGRDPLWFQDADLSEHPVQVKLVFDNYDGQRRLKVERLRPHGSAIGGVSKADDATKIKIRNRLSSKLRAAGKATPPPKASPPDSGPQEPAEPTSATSTKEEAWDEFVKHTSGDDWTDEEREQQWFRILGDLFPGKQPDELSPTDWARMRDEGPGGIIPF